MKNQTEPGQKTDNNYWWMLLPFTEQILILILFTILAPASWSIYLFSRGNFLLGIAVLIMWGATFSWLAAFLNRRRHVRLWVSLPTAAIILLISVVVFFSP